MSVILSKCEWVLCCVGERLILWRDQMLFLEWDALPCKTYRCHISDEELKVIGNHDQSLVCDYIDLQEKRRYRQEYVLEVNFPITNFQVIFSQGWILCCDNVSGALYMFDSMEDSYKGLLRLSSIQDEIYLCEGNRFQVFCNKFDHDTLTGQVFLNTYDIQRKAAQLICSIPLKSGLPIHRAVHDPQFKHFAIVSSCKYQRLCHLQLFLSNASRPFYEHVFRDADTYLLSFFGPFSFLLVSTVRQQTYLQLFDILEGQVKHSVLLSTKSIVSFHRLNASNKFLVANAASISIPAEPQVRLLRAERARRELIYFTLVPASPVLYVWHPELDCGLFALQFPSAPIALTTQADGVLFVPDGASSARYAAIPRLDQLHDLRAKTLLATPFTKPDERVKK